MNTKLELGGVYSVNWDKRPMRILAFDDKEIFYDYYWPELGKWTFSGNIRTLTFYRISTEYFVLNSRQIDLLNLTKKEYALFKPNFPLRFCRIKEFNFCNFHEILNNLPNYNNIESDCKIIFQNKIVLLPKIKKGRTIKGEIVELKNIYGLFIKTKELQESVKNTTFNGIGFYRSGTINKIPSYYIGEYID
jgi:hypothetical protein